MQLFIIRHFYQQIRSKAFAAMAVFGRGRPLKYAHSVQLVHVHAGTISGTTGIIQTLLRQIRLANLGGLVVGWGESQRIGHSNSSSSPGSPGDRLLILALLIF